MLDLVKKAIAKFSLIEKGDTVTVAISGGADSVALLHSLLSLKEEYELTVKAAHLNHLIRGDEAFRDQQFVEKLCNDLGVEFICEQIDVPKYATDNHLSLELAARTLRYDFLSRIQTDKIATAHTASDNLETMIFNLTRGTALKGLTGIPAVRGNIIRPLIFATRYDVESYCKNNNLSYVTDSTNLSDDYTRNKIRHNIVPILKEINPKVEQAAVRTGISLLNDSDYIEYKSHEVMFKNLLDDALHLGFLTEGEAIAKRVIIEYFSVSYPNVLLENRHVNDLYSICLSGNGKINLPSDIFAVVENNTLRFLGDFKDETKNFNVKITKMENVNNLFSNDLIDCDKIKGKLIVRTRLEGDSIRLYKRGCTKTLKKLFTEYKIPSNERSTLPVIADDNGVVWVHSIGVAERVAVKESSINVYKIEVL